MTVTPKLTALVLSLFMVVSVGCTNVSTTDSNKSQETQQSQTQDKTKGTKDAKDTEQTKEAHAVNEKIGLSDSLGAWEKAVGHAYAQGDTIKVFANGSYKVVFQDNQAVTVTFVSKNGQNPVEAAMLPSDGEKQSESSKNTGGMTMVVQKWHSDALAVAMPETKGNYTLMKNMNGNDYDTVVVDCTPNLRK